MTKKELEKEIKRLQKEIDEITLENIYLKEQEDKENKIWGINPITL